MKRTILCSLAALMAVAVPAAGLQEKEKKYYNSYLGKVPPKLKIGKKDWINSRDPLALEGLRGKVVWLEFSYTH